MKPPMLPLLIGLLVGGAAALWLAKPEINVQEPGGSPIAWALAGAGAVGLLVLFFKAKRR